MSGVRIDSKQHGQESETGEQSGASEATRTALAPSNSSIASAAAASRGSGTASGVSNLFGSDDIPAGLLDDVVIDDEGITVGDDTVTFEEILDNITVGEDSITIGDETVTVGDVVEVISELDPSLLPPGAVEIMQVCSSGNNGATDTLTCGNDKGSVTLTNPDTDYVDGENFKLGFDSLDGTYAHGDQQATLIGGASDISMVDDVGSATINDYAYSSNSSDESTAWQLETGTISSTDDGIVIGLQNFSMTHEEYESQSPDQVAAGVQGALSSHFTLDAEVLDVHLGSSGISVGAENASLTNELGYVNLITESGAPVTATLLKDDSGNIIASVQLPESAVAQLGDGSTQVGIAGHDSTYSLTENDDGSRQWTGTNIDMTRHTEADTFGLTAGHGAVTDKDGNYLVSANDAALNATTEDGTFQGTVGQGTVFDNGSLLGGTGTNVGLNATTEDGVFDYTAGQTTFATNEDGSVFSGSDMNLSATTEDGAFQYTAGQTTLATNGETSMFSGSDMNLNAGTSDANFSYSAGHTAVATGPGGSVHLQNIENAQATITVGEHYFDLNIPLLNEFLLQAYDVPNMTEGAGFHFVPTSDGSRLSFRMETSLGINFEVEDAAEFFAYAGASLDQFRLKATDPTRQGKARLELGPFMKVEGNDIDIVAIHHAYDAGKHQRNVLEPLLREMDGGDVTFHWDPAAGVISLQTPGPLYLGFKILHQPLTTVEGGRPDFGTASYLLNAGTKFHIGGVDGRFEGLTGLTSSTGVELFSLGDGGFEFFDLIETDNLFIPASVTAMGRLNLDWKNGENGLVVTAGVTVNPTHMVQSELLSDGPPAVVSTGIGMHLGQLQFGVTASQGTDSFGGGSADGSKQEYDPNYGFYVNWSTEF